MSLVLVFPLRVTAGKMQSLYKKKTIKVIRERDLKHVTEVIRSSSKNKLLNSIRSIDTTKDTKLPTFVQKTLIPTREEQLKKWKEEKLLRKERELRLKKPAFKVGVTQSLPPPLLSLSSRSRVKPLGFKPAEKKCLTETVIPNQKKLKGAKVKNQDMNMKAQQDMHGAIPSIVCPEDNTPLMLACAAGHEDIVRVLLDAGARVEDHNENGHTPLMEAARAGHVEVAKLLVNRGASINTHSNEFKESALTLACYKGHLEMVRFLLAAGADLEHKTDEMHTALMEASMDGHVEVARLLLDSGAQVNMPADSFESPLTLAACGGHVELAMLLLDRGANIEEVNDEGYMPLMEAAREGHEEMVALLLSQGVNLKKGVYGIHMTLSREGRPSGEAYVEVESEEDLTKALEKHNDHMGHRYIEADAENDYKPEPFSCDLSIIETRKSFAPKNFIFCPPELNSKKNMETTNKTSTPCNDLSPTTDEKSAKVFEFPENGLGSNSTCAASVLTYNFENLHLEDKMKKVSLLYTPRQGSSEVKFIKGDLICFGTPPS